MKFSLTPTPLLQPLGYTFSTILVGLNEGVKRRESACLGVIINGMGTVPIQMEQPKLRCWADASWNSSRIGAKTGKSPCSPPARKKCDLQYLIAAGTCADLFPGPVSTLRRTPIHRIDGERGLHGCKMHQALSA